MIRHFLKFSAAAAKSLQSCPTLCNPIDGSPPGSCPQGSPGKNTGVRCHFLLQGIFPTQGSNPRLLHWQAGSSPQCHLGSPYCIIVSQYIVSFSWAFCTSYFPYLPYASVQFSSVIVSPITWVPFSFLSGNFAPMCSSEIRKVGLSSSWNPTGLPYH